MEETKTTEIHSGVWLTEYRDGLLFGTDALLLSRFVRGGKGMRGVDIGSGSGALSLILLAENKASSMTGLEIQPRFAALSERNAKQNGFADRYKAVCGDARRVRDFFSAERADFVVSNPPFMKAASGKPNPSEAKRVARHEEYLPADELCKAASYLLRFGGAFYTVYRPERLCTLLCAMRERRLEPKRISFALSGEKASLVLVEAKKGAAEGAQISFTQI